MRTEITLLPEGHFYYKTIRKDISHNKGIHPLKEQTQSGRWSWGYSGTEDAMLILRFESGKELNLDISYRDHKGLLLNGKRFEVEELPPEGEIINTA